MPKKQKPKLDVNKPVKTNPREKPHKRADRNRSSRVASGMARLRSTGVW